jgi:DnaK suppressor protein
MTPGTKKAAAAKAPATKAPTANKTVAAKGPAAKQTAASTPVKKASAVNKTAASTPVKKASAVNKTAASTPVKKAPAVKKATTTAARSLSRPTPGGSVASRKPETTGSVTRVKAKGPYADDQKFLDEQFKLLHEERAIYQGQAEDLRAEADSLAFEREPGDVQFDEESGEGGTVAVDRERDLALSAQALAAVEEIDFALAAVADKTYGGCEICHQPIPKPRLKAVPYARLCVACKSGGLHRR